ncbi:MAG: FtsX-like permease family protein [Lachnospiraceae bacterium]|nr:FtsX-like permease family protein [Lachnospiraceae bacterium]
MKRLTQMGIVFMKNSKMLTFSAFLSIFVACFLSISMFQLSSNVKASMEASLAAKKGKFDIQIMKRDGTYFNEEEIEFLEQEKTVKGTSGGYQTDELLDTYMVGVIDDDINKSLYKYKKNVKEKQIIINDSLGRRENKTVGDVFEVAGKNFQIIEVIETDSRSDYKMPMAIMELSQIHQLLGHTDTEQINYMLLQCHDFAYDAAALEHGDGLVDRIEQQYPGFWVLDQRVGDDYQTVQNNIIMIFRVFFVVVMIVSGLFVVNIFMEYMRKYRKDMAIIRTVGGKQKQVRAIFCSMSAIISAGGCLAGALFSALVSGVTLNWFNDKLQLFDGSASLNWKVLCQITIIIFVLFNFFVYVVFYFGQTVLPIQVFQKTSSELRRNKKAYRLLILRKMIGKSGYLGIKLMAPKFRQNFMIIFIVALITALSYTGQASLKLLMANDSWYHYNLVGGKTAMGEIWAEKTMSLSYVHGLYDRFQPVMGSGYMIYGDFSINSSDQNNVVLNSFSVSDLETLPLFPSVKIWKQYETVPKAKRIVMEKTAANEKGCKLGDTVTLESDYLGGQKDFILVEIINADNLTHDMYNIVVDWNNLCEKDFSDENMCGIYLGLWLDGNKELIREKFQRLQLEPGINFEGSIYDDIMEESDHIRYQWTTTLHIVLAMLMLVSGIGLLNSAKGMLLARKKEYQVLRMLGATEGSVRRICWMQVWSYMLSGVVLGAVLGVVVVTNLWEAQVITNTPITIDWQYIAGIVIYLFGLSLLLHPSIKKMR